MNKQAFLDALSQGLRGLPKEDIEKSIEYYSEMIEDRIEDGMTEEEAVAACGKVDELIQQTFSDASLPKLIKARMTPDRALKTWELLLLVLGSPIWLSLAIAAVTVFFTVYILLWSMLVACYAIDAALAICGVTGVFGMIAYFAMGNPTGAFMVFGLGLLCMGLSVFAFYALNALTKGTVWVSKKIILAVKGFFIKRR